MATVQELQVFIKPYVTNDFVKKVTGTIISGEWEMYQSKSQRTSRFIFDTNVIKTISHSNMLTPNTCLEQIWSKQVQRFGLILTVSAEHTGHRLHTTDITYLKSLFWVPGTPKWMFLMNTQNLFLCKITILSQHQIQIMRVSKSNKSHKNLP